MSAVFYSTKKSLLYYFMFYLQEFYAFMHNFCHFLSNVLLHIYVVWPVDKYVVKVSVLL